MSSRQNPLHLSSCCYRFSLFGETISLSGVLCHYRFGGPYRFAVFGAHLWQENLCNTKVVFNHLGRLTYIYICKYINMQLYIYMYIDISIYIYKYKCIKCTYICIYNVYIYIYMHICVFIYIYVNIYICIYLHIYTYIYT